MGNNAVAVSSISGDFPQKLASLGIDALVLTGKYSDGNAVILVEASSIRIEHMPQLQGKSCSDIVEYIRSTFGGNCAAIGTGRAADMLLPLGALFTTYHSALHLSAQQLWRCCRKQGHTGDSYQRQGILW